MGCLYFFGWKEKSPPNPPISVTTSGRKVFRTMGRISFTNLLPASISTPALLYVTRRFKFYPLSLRMLFSRFSSRLEFRFAFPALNLDLDHFLLYQKPIHKNRLFLQRPLLLPQEVPRHPPIAFSFSLPPYDFSMPCALDFHDRHFFYLPMERNSDSNK
jgi:hypothetical protein